MSVSSVAINDIYQKIQDLRDLAADLVQEAQAAGVCCALEDDEEPLLNPCHAQTHTGVGLLVNHCGGMLETPFGHVKLFNGRFSQFPAPVLESLIKRTNSTFSSYRPRCGSSGWEPARFCASGKQQIGQDALTLLLDTHHLVIPQQSGDVAVYRIGMVKGQSMPTRSYAPSQDPEKLRTLWNALESEKQARSCLHIH